MEHIANLDNSKTITDKGLMIRSMVTLALVILGFVTHDITGIPAYVFAVAGASFLLIFEKPKEIYCDVEWLTIFFFIGLFIIIGGFEAIGRQTYRTHSGKPDSRYNVHFVGFRYTFRCY